ncbi:MAG: S8 family serine peptidase, partial [Halothiobacillaceae bacterium]|nr:S8 family serine peptidase [Halothiobacillaceae bacterium]
VSTESDPDRLAIIRHATIVNGLVAGDTTRGQDETLTPAFRASPSYRYILPLFRPSREAQMLADHSGFARDTDVIALRVGSNGWFSMSRAFNTLREASVEVPLANMSFAEDYAAHPERAGTDCDGIGVDARRLNTWYEDGGLSVQAAGNFGFATLYTDHGLEIPDCTLDQQGSALTAFTVGGVADTYFDSSPPDIRRHVTASYGPAEGRTMVKVAAPVSVESPYRLHGPDGWDGVSYGPAPTDPEGQETLLRGTSFATARVTGAAAVFRDWYQETYSGLIDSPGMLAAHLLHMGDRHAGDGARLETGFDHELGAGLLQLRMSEPTYRRTSHELCMSTSGTAVSINLGRPILSAFDAIDGTLWWYDTDQDEGSALTDLDLHLM